MFKCKLFLYTGNNANGILNILNVPRSRVSLPTYLPAPWQRRRCQMCRPWPPGLRHPVHRVHTCCACKEIGHVEVNPYMPTSAHAYMYTFVHKHIYIYTHIYMCVRVYACMYVFTHTHIHIQTHTPNTCEYTCGPSSIAIRPVLSGLSMTPHWSAHV